MAAVLLLAVLCLLRTSPASADDLAPDHADAARDRALIDARLARMPAQRPGQLDLFALAFAGDGHEDVFRNEAAYFETLATARYGAAGRTLALVNHPDSLDRTPRPLATLGNLQHALDGIAARMDPDEDLLLLFLTSHGGRDHALTVSQPDRFDTTLSPVQLRDALDAAGIRHRLLIVSACFSGGFIPELAAPDTLIITAARHDRPSFGCGDTASATYFGRALLVEGLNRDGGLVDAFGYARRQVARREVMEGHEASFPQINVGERIRARLDAWEAALVRGPLLPYPHPL
ncbi:C13 family peptidase [Luteimonas kalidii]|uniref:C13 family peptidase n=1 Tax=Luteimonas kalidii TaxID=3042025 RepID=A0ABT6JU20_9GAMM|nr:C13 family peptidase [Luteimonas kalidii]MDH5834190.1 C13 family peptidase [Luteimonas kalidii]